MKTMCDICNHEKETIVKELHLEYSEKEKKQWNVCETCKSAFQVLEDYVQGQN